MRKKMVLLLVAILLLLGAIFIINMNQFEERKVPVEITQDESRTIVFYRDDCSDCRRVFPFLYTRNLLCHDLLFVNMNEAENRKYIARYDLKTVPTIINGNESYSGDNLEKIFSFINQN